MANNEILFKPNSLIMATNNTGNIRSAEYKVFDTLLQRCQYNKDYGFRKAELTRREIKEIIKHDADGTVKAISNTLDKFMSIKLDFILNKKIVHSTAISQYIYNPATDTFTCSMTEEVFIALINYSNLGYSEIDLKLLRRSRTYYTQRIYGMLRKWSKTDKPVKYTYTLDEIKNICDISINSTYPDYKDFKRRVLNPSIKEINEKLNMNVKFKEIRVMRKVQKIEFTFIDHEPKNYEFNKVKIIEPKEIIVVELDIDSVDYVNMVDCKLNESMHKTFLKDFSDYKDYIKALKAAANKTLDAIGGKTINKKNYKYFKTTLENLIPSIILDD